MYNLRPLLILMMIAGNITAQSVQNKQPGKPVITDMLVPAITAQMKGHIGEKLDASYQNRILVQDVDQLVEPFRHRNEIRDRQ